MTKRRTFVSNLAALAAMPLAWSAGLAGAATQSYDFSPQQRGRVRAPKDPDAQRLIAGYRFVTPGVFTVAVAPFAAPIATYATDARSIVGSDPDYSQLVADAFGLRLQLVPVAWPDCPLGLASGRYDAVISNVGVTGKRKQKFDFTTYRLGLHGFYVRNDSPISSISEPRDIAGLRVFTRSGAIQERILLEWNRRNTAQGLKEAVVRSETNPPGFPDA